jgi:hypothetical protein
VLPVGGAPSRHTGTGGATAGVHAQCLRDPGAGEASLVVPRAAGRQSLVVPREAARRSQVVPQSKQLGSQTRRCRAGQAAGQVAFSLPGPWCIAHSTEATRVAPPNTGWNQYGCHWYLEQKKNDEVAVRIRLRSSHYPGKTATAEGTGSSCSALTARPQRQRELVPVALP